MSEAGTIISDLHDKIESLATERADLKAKLAQVDADAAAMRERMKELEHSDQMWDEHMSPFTDYEGDEAPWKTMAREFETLRATAQRRLELLRKCEWMGHAYAKVCPCCGSSKTDGHKPDCQWAAELKEAK